MKAETLFCVDWRSWGFGVTLTFCKIFGWYFSVSFGPAYLSVEIR